MTRGTKDGAINDDTLRAGSSCRPVRLRGHHLLCVLTYIGRGYSAEFVANFDAVASVMSGDGRVEIVDGPDEICRPVMYDDDSHCFEADTRHRDMAALADLSRLLGRPLSPGDHMTLDGDCVDRLRTAFAANDVRSACHGCQWHQICSGVAGGGFDGVRLRPRREADDAETC